MQSQCHHDATSRLVRFFESNDCAIILSIILPMVTISKCTTCRKCYVRYGYRKAQNPHCNFVTVARHWNQRRICDHMSVTVFKKINPTFCGKEFRHGEMKRGFLKGVEFGL